jgi:glycosyltransferase involved in cell wall biosynthesis
MEKTKIMLMTDSNTRTGFGGVSHNIAIGLAENNFDVSWLGWGFHADGPMPRANYILLPSGQAPFGEDILPYYLQVIKPEVFMTQADTRMVMNIPQALKQVPNKPAWVFYVVIDGSTWDYKGENKKWPTNWLNCIKQADKVVTMTKFGQDILQANGVESQVIYHGVETSRYTPISEENKRKLKASSGLQEDLFIFGGVFKNMARKCPEKYLQAFKIFYESLNEAQQSKVALLLHTNPGPGPSGEFDLVEQCVDYGLTPGKNVIFSMQNVPPDLMQLVYQSMDVYLHLGTMEGFGLPIIEAMSCGIPSIGINSCTMPELIGDCGILSEVPRYNKTHKISFGSYNGVECDIVDPWDIAKKMQKLYESEALRKELGFKSTERAVKTFDWSIIRKQWVDLMKSLVITEDKIPEEWQKLYAETKV